MWLTQFQTVISDDEPYKSTNGTSYPANFPKSEIPGLLPVQIVAQPVTTQYQTATQTGVEFVGGHWRQVWTVTDWTQAQIDAYKKSLVPKSVTMRQARLSLMQAGLLPTVNAAIAAMTGAAGDAARIEWEYSQEVQRSRGLVMSLGTSLGMTDAQLDNLFIAAAAIL